MLTTFYYYTIILLLNGFFLFPLKMILIRFILTIAAKFAEIQYK